VAGSGFLTVAKALLPVPLRLPCALLAGGNLLCAVDDSKHVDLIRLDVVDNSIGAFDYLPDLGDPELRHLAP